MSKLDVLIGEVQWSRQLFDSMNMHATWAVPRSGLIFQKVSERELQLINLFPWSEDMGKAFAHGYDVPPDKTELRAYQQADFEAIAKRFEAAGIILSDPRQLLKD